MKLYCLDCGCHFADEFEKTLKCNFWVHRGLQKLTRKQKKKIWDYLFSFDTDSFAAETGITLSIDMGGEKYNGNEFEKTVPGYKGWDDKTRRNFQKNWFKWVGSLSPKQREEILMIAFYHHIESESQDEKK